MTASAGRLALEDIDDLRAYERHRHEFRGRVIELKRRRRVALGPIVTVVFENRDTIRFQVQEMARIEKMTSDAQIQAELDVYNPLIPGPGELSLTLFIELTDEAALREWLGMLVGVERSLRLRLGEDPGAMVVAGSPEEAHEDQLTRDHVTASVHYVRFLLGAEEVARFAAGPVSLEVDHPAYRHRTGLSEETRGELLRDLRS